MSKDNTSQKLAKSQYAMVAIVMSGGFITLLNQLVMSPALPSVMKDLNITASTGQWLMSIFLLVNGLMVPITAYLINRFTSRQIYIAAMCAFTAGSIVAAMSSGFTVLLLGRIIQAVGAGIMLPFSIVMLLLIFPKSRRGFALGIAGVVIGFAPAFGPTLAGWIVDVWGWRYIFVFITPIAAILMIFAICKLENIGERSAGKLDWLSVALSTVGFGGLLYGFSIASEFGWVSPYTLGPICIGAVTLVFFARRQLSRSDPMLNLRILRNGVFSTSTILAAVVSAGLTVGAVVTPIYLQTVMGLSALHSGLMLMPGALCMAGMSPISGILFDRFGPRALSITGLLIMTTGSVMLAFLGVSSPYAYVCIGYSLRMFGISMVNMPVNTWGLNVLSNRLIAHGNAINNTARQVGGSLGTAILVTVMMIVIANSDLPGAQATVAGINAAFRGACGLTAAALILTIVRVKGEGNGEDY